MSEPGFGEQLGHRPDAIDRLRVGQPGPGQVGVAEALGPDNSLVVYEGN